MHMYFIIFILLLLCPGCLLGPHYQKPKTNVPSKYTHAQEQTNTPAQVASWWKYFDDTYLNDLIKQALENNYSLHIALEKIKETRALYRIQEAHQCPIINLDGTVQQVRSSKNVTQSATLKQRNLSYLRAGFDALWEIDLWGKLKHARDAAHAEYEAEIENTRDVYIMLLSDVVKTYIDCRTLQKKICIREKQINTDTQLLTLTKDRFSAGIASEIPDTEQQVALEESKNELILLQTSLKQTINRLALLLGQTPEQFTFTHQSNTPDMPVFKKTVSPGLPSKLLQRRPDIRKAERLLAAAHEHVGQARADWFPSFSLLGSIGPESNRGSKLISGNSLSWSIGPSIQWPIIAFGRIEFNIAAKESAQKQALLAYGNSVVNALGDVENCLISYFNEQKRRSILQQKLLAITKESMLAHSLLNSGLVSETDYLNIEKKRLLIEFELTDVQQSLNTTIIALYKSLGGEW